MTKPSNPKIGLSFDTIAQRYENIIDFYSVDRRREQLVKWAKGKCLEVGAGTGVITQGLIKKGLDVTATDISSEMIKILQQKLRVKTYVSDCEKLPILRVSIDTVIASEVIYYLDRPALFLKEAYRVLKPKGRLLISAALTRAELYDKGRSLLRRLGLKKMYFDDPVKKFISLEALEDLIGKSGFQLRETKCIIIFPHHQLDWLNRYLEKTLFSRFALFGLIYAEKKI